MAKKVIMVGIDGCHQATLYDLIEKREAPFFAKLVDNGTLVENAVTMFPSTTGPCCSTLYTGCWYKNHGVLNNEWFDRFASPVAPRSYIAGLHHALASFDRKLFGWPSILLPNTNTGGSFNNDLQVPTVYEEFTRAGKISYTMFHYIGRGATKWIRPSRMDMLRYAMVEQYHKPFQMYERHMVTKAIMNIKAGMPDLLSIYFGCNDGHSHRHGVPAQRDYLKTFVDPEMARLGAAVEKMFPNDEICWAITADHGQTNVTRVENGMWWDTFSPILHQQGYNQVDQSIAGTELDTSDAVVSLGDGATVNFYLKCKKSGNWNNQPDFDTQVVPLLNSFLKANDAMEPFKDWKQKGYLDFLLTRKTFKDPYMIYVNDPPYDGPGRLIPLEEFFEGKTHIHLRPIERIRGWDHPKNSDIIVVLNYGEEFCVADPDDYHPGQHGSLMPEDSLVPMIFSGPGIKKGHIKDAMTVDFSPTAAAIAGVEMPKADGSVLPIF